MNPRSLKKMLRDGEELALLDVREAGQFGLEHMLHAVPCPFSVLEARAPLLAPRRTVRTVLVDADDGVAERAAIRLADLGYDNISILEGGNHSWRAAGYETFQGVNVPSKAFGEIVEHAARTPHVTADELHAMKRRGDDLVILDGRTPEEHTRMSIPGGVSVPNAELMYRVHDLAPDPGTTIIVNCAGRTRSIIGAQTLIDAGVPNRVVALKAGTMGWKLAGRELEHGSTLRYPEIPSRECTENAASYARDMIRKFGIPMIDAATLDAWKADSGRTLFLFDVRTREEFDAGHPAGAVHAPGGQLVQATDHWCGVWGARVVLLDDAPCARAVATAHWLRRMGWDACALDTEGLETGDSVSVDTPAAEEISCARLADEMRDGRIFLIDAGQSADYRAAHLPGAVWGIRPRLDRLDIPDGKPIVVYSGRRIRAALAARDLSENRPVRVLAGGREAWIAEGRPTVASPGVPPDGDAIDYLFLMSARHQGDDAAARAYLDWEENLPAQVAADGDARFRL